MLVPEDILIKCCTGCPRCCEGICPFSILEKDICPRIREMVAGKDESLDRIDA